MSGATPLSPPLPLSSSPTPFSPTPSPPYLTDEGPEPPRGKAAGPANGWPGTAGVRRTKGRAEPGVEDGTGRGGLGWHGWALGPGATAGHGRKGRHRRRKVGRGAYYGPCRLSVSRSREVDPDSRELPSSFPVKPLHLHSESREPWQRGRYGGRAGPDGAAFPDRRERRLRGQGLPEKTEALPDAGLALFHVSASGCRRRLLFVQVIWPD